MYQLKNVILKK